MIITAPEHRTFYLNPGETLSVVADAASAGTIWRLGDSAGDAPQSPVSVAASETKTVGPFTGITRFDVVPSAGFLTATQGLSAVGTSVQAYDLDLQEVADLSASNDDIIQRKIGVWTNRTIAQLKTDLSLSGTNTGDQTLPVKASGAEVDTGTNDAKFLTPKAIEDSAYAKTSAITIEAAESASSITPKADGTYTVGLGVTTNGTITIKAGIITAIVEAS